MLLWGAQGPFAMAAGLGKDQCGGLSLSMPAAVTMMSAVGQAELWEAGWVLLAREATTSVSVMRSFALSTSPLVWGVG